MASTEQQILASSRVVAMVGISANPERPSNGVARYLMGNGYEVIPVNPNEKEILGETCYPDLGSVPVPVDVVDIFRKSEDVLPIAEAAVRIGAKALWMQEGVKNKEAAALARKAGLRVVMDKCMRKQHTKYYGGDSE